MKEINKWRFEMNYDLTIGASKRIDWWNGEARNEWVSSLTNKRIVERKDRLMYELHKKWKRMDEY